MVVVPKTAEPGTNGVGVKTELPALMIVKGGLVSEEDFEKLAHFASMNNCVLRKSGRDAVPLGGRAFQVRDILMRGLTYRAIRVAEDLTPDEYRQLTREINPHCEDRPLEEVLVEEGLKSLMQIRDRDVPESREQERLGNLRLGIKVAQSMLRKAGEVDVPFADEEKAAAFKLEVKTDGQVAALKYLQNIFHKHLPHVSYTGPVLREQQSPRRTLHNLDAVCEQKTLLAYAVLRGCGLKTSPANVLVDHRNVGVTHACLLCELADGRHYIFDANIPEQSGVVPKDAEVSTEEFPTGTGETIVEMAFNQKTSKRGVFEVTPHYRKLQIMPAGDYIMSGQYTILANTYVAQGMQDLADDKADAAAEEAFRRALEVNPRNTAARINLGLLYDNHDRPDEALREYETLLSITPRFADAHFNIARVYSRQNRRDDAVRECLTGLEIDPLSVEGHYNLSVLYRMLGRGEDADREFEESRRLGR